MLCNVLPFIKEIMKCTEKDDARRWSIRPVGDISLATSKDTYRYAEFHIFSVMNQYTYGFWKVDTCVFIEYK